MRRAADLISERQMELAALMVLEVGKNRLEALGDVEETAELFRYYSERMEENDGFDHPMDNLGDASVHTRRAQAARRLGDREPVQLPDGTSRRPVRGGDHHRQHRGVQPSSDAPLLAMKLYEIYVEAGLPNGVFNYVGARVRRSAPS